MDNKDQVQLQLQNLRQVQGVLRRIFSEAGTHGVYLVDESGFLIAEAGKINLDRVALAALVAASFGATAEIARLLGEKSFNQLTQQGENRNLFICKAGERHIVIAVFGKETNLGLVKLYVEKAVVHLGALLDYVPPELKKAEREGVEDLVGETPVDLETTDAQAESEIPVDEEISEHEAELLRSFREFVSDESIHEADTFERMEDEEGEAVPEEQTRESLAETTLDETETGGETETEPARDEEDTDEQMVVEDTVDLELESILGDAEQLGSTADTAESPEVTPQVEALDLEMHEETIHSDEAAEEALEEEPVESTGDEDIETDLRVEIEASEPDETAASESEQVSEEISIEEIEPEIDRLTQELEAEIAQLREQSKILEIQLSQQEEGAEQPPDQAKTTEVEASEGMEPVVSEEGEAAREQPEIDTTIDPDVGIAVDTDEADEKAIAITGGEKVETDEQDEKKADDDAEGKKDRDGAFPSWLDEN